MSRRLLADTATVAFSLAGPEANVSAIRAVLYRWRKQGLVAQYGGKGKGEARWDLREIRTALERHTEAHGKPPWENGRGPGREVKK